MLCSKALSLSNYVTGPKNSRSAGAPGIHGDKLQNLVVILRWCPHHFAIAQGPGLLGLTSWYFTSPLCFFSITQRAVRMLMATPDDDLSVCLYITCSSGNFFKFLWASMVYHFTFDLSPPSKILLQGILLPSYLGIFRNSLLPEESSGFSPSDDIYCILAPILALPRDSFAFHFTHCFCNKM